MTVVKPKWIEIREAKQAAREALIPEAWRVVDTGALNVLDVPSSSGILSADELAITERTASDLVSALANGKLKSADVTLAFCKRAAIAQQLTNCLSEIMFDSALEYAKTLDAEFERTGQLAGPLHGLPVSMKDCFFIEGVDTTIGFVTFANDPATRDQESEITKVMRESGAVMFCKTNVPTAMMMAESYNNLFGYTVNPANRKLTAGGSSGGEGALLAMKGAPLGVGTDIGGSIRIPTSFNGIFGLKPSFGRFPTYGSRPGLVGQEAIRSINGPMAPTLDAVKLWTKVVVDSEPWTRDPNMIPLPWREYTPPDKLCFGIMMQTKTLRPTPPVTRVLLETKAALEKAGHKVIEYEGPDATETETIVSGFFLGDGGAKIASLIAQSGEDWPEGLLHYRDRYEQMKGGVPPLVGDLWEMQLRRVTYAKKNLEAWQATAAVTGTGRPIDGLITPTTAFSAPPILTYKNVTYTSMWNLNDQSSCVFPAGKAEPSIDIKPDYQPNNEEEQYVWDHYDPAQLEDAPVGLQMVTRRLEEEKAIALAGVAYNALSAFRS